MITSGRFLLILCLFIALFNISAYSQEKMRIALLDIAPKGISQIAANSATNIVRSEFVNFANFTIVERSAMDEIFREQELQMSGCTDQSCAVKVGKLLSARKIIVGEINRMGEAVLLTLRIIDVEKGQSEYSAREKAQSIEYIDLAAVNIARKLTQRIVSGEKEFFSPQTPLGYYARSIAPGWGQVYAGNSLKGAAFGGMFLLSGLIYYFQYSAFKDKEDAYHYESLHSDKFEQRRNDYKDAALYCNISLGIMAFVYIAHWADIIFFSKPDFGVSAVETAFGENNINIDLCAGPANGYYKEETNINMEINFRF